MHMCKRPSPHLGAKPASGRKVCGLKDKRTRKKEQEEVSGGNNMLMDMEGEEVRHKEEKGPRAASAWHSQRGAEQKRREKQLAAHTPAGQGLQEF